MIKFQERTKTYSEYDAMRELYNELKKNSGEYDDNKKFEIISKSYLPGILKGNSVVVEKFTSVTKVFGRDRYRMYIRVGAKAKMPDNIRMPKSYKEESIPLSFRIDNPIKKDTSNDNNGNNQNQNYTRLSFQNTISKILGDSISYDKKNRLFVLEVDTVNDAAKALKVLPFGLGYKIYLLD